MKTLLTVLTLVLFTAQSQAADEGRTLMNPSDSLRNNECVFKQSNIREKKIPQLLDYDYIINSCDAKPTSSLIIWADHMKQGYCVYDLVQKMTGYTIARVMKPCPTMQQAEPEIRIDNINDEEIGAMPPAFTDEDVAAKPVKKTIVKQNITKKETPAEDVQPKAEEKADAKPKKEKDNEDAPDIKNYVPPQGVDNDF